MQLVVNAKSVIRRGVVYYSIRNRRAKAAAISAWLDSLGCKTILLIGAMGEAHIEPNGDIVENAVANGREVRLALNIDRVATPHPFVVADGRHLPLQANVVDFALANAIIEHVGGEADQRRFVAEQTRVARNWVITTPNKWFPVESHTSVVFAHWLPSWRRDRIEFTRLLSLREFKSLLPAGAKVTGHWWTPTFTAYYAKE
ncbi:methyltransferase domain-containing protein [Antrihabitans sp. YC2-6]|uniref:methyltransferase domain-containing protein n=1 Tax=Antrihabitans sp. YC2-6 TaxID=2799498 RepID=UPI0018F360E7|nr:methyltransferase domain-containing protein [Antrihabitans sp. YC2-6]MBJ8348707.1 methyltransferase domain-containing protein [Antrihabitans sp. YC2-6]